MLFLWGRQIIGLIFSKKLVFDGQSYRTTRVNKAIRLIWALGEGCSENKNGQTDEKIDLSTLVTRPGFELTYFVLISFSL